jgi:hypothetical protein
MRLTWIIGFGFEITPAFGQYFYSDSRGSTAL